MFLESCSMLISLFTRHTGGSLWNSHKAMSVCEISRGPYLVIRPPTFSCFSLVVTQRSSLTVWGGVVVVFISAFLFRRSRALFPLFIQRVVRVFNGVRLRLVLSRVNPRPGRRQEE